MSAIVASLSMIGGGALELCRNAGGMALLAARTFACLLTGRFDRQELLKNMYKMGSQSVPIVLLTAFFTGGTMVIQSGIFVRRFGAFGLLGFGAGFATLREIGPILIGLMFSGRVGANNAAELGTMTVTEQLDGLRALSIDPFQFLVAPRVLAMMISLFTLLVLGDAVALTGGALFGKLLLNVEFSSFYHSLADNLHPWDLLAGLIKGLVFGFCIAVTSCYYGCTVTGGAVGVGRAVNNAVVAAAISIMCADNILTMLMR